MKFRDLAKKLPVRAHTASDIKSLLKKMHVGRKLLELIFLMALLALNMFDGLQILIARGCGAAYKFLINSCERLNRDV